MVIVTLCQGKPTRNTALILSDSKIPHGGKFMVDKLFLMGIMTPPLWGSINADIDSANQAYFSGKVNCALGFGTESLIACFITISYLDHIPSTYLTLIRSKGCVIQAAALEESPPKYHRDRRFSDMFPSVLLVNQTRETLSGPSCVSLSSDTCLDSHYLISTP